MEPELRRLLDRQEITDLIYDYCAYVDTYQPAKVAALFTANCITDYGPAFGGEVVGQQLVEKGLVTQEQEKSDGRGRPTMRIRAK